MDAQPTQKASYSSAVVTAIAIFLCAVVLGGGVFIWKKKNQAQIRELQNAVEGLTGKELDLRNDIAKDQDVSMRLENEMDDLQKQSAELDQKTLSSAFAGGEKCFLSGVLSVAAMPDSSWYLNRNMHTGYQYQIAENMMMSRDAVSEEDGIEVFAITSKEYSKGVLLKAYDIRKRRYVYSIDERSSISYDATSDLWYKTSAKNISSACAPDEFITTVGKLPVYVIGSGDGSRAYLVLAKVEAAKANAAAFVIEISLNTKEPSIPKGFLSNLEGLIQSIDRIGGLYPY